MGVERRRQVHAAQARRRRSRSPTRAASTLGASVKLGYFAQHAMELLDAEHERVRDAAETRFPMASVGSLRTLAGALRLLGRRRREALPRALGRREGAPRARAHALRPAELPGARRADQPPRHRHQGDADRARSPTSRARCCSSRTTAASCARSRTACSSSTPTGRAHLRRRLRRVRRASGHEAPGMRSAG